MLISGKGGIWTTKIEKFVPKITFFALYFLQSDLLVQVTHEI